MPSKKKEEKNVKHLLRSFKTAKRDIWDICAMANVELRCDSSEITYFKD